MRGGQSAVISNPLPVVNVVDEEQNDGQVVFSNDDDDDCGDVVSKDNPSLKVARITSKILLCGPASIMNGFINEVPAKILVDTGASMSIVNKTIHNTHFSHVALRPGDVNSTSVTGDPVRFKGVFLASLRLGECSIPGFLRCLTNRPRLFDRFIRNEWLRACLHEAGWPG